MARSRTDICNSALAYIADVEISDYEQADSTPARLCRRFYDNCIETLSEIHEWSFLTTISSLTFLRQQEYKGLTYNVFALPSDFLRIVNAGQDEQEYNIIGDEFFCFDEKISICYVKYNQDPNVFSPLFVEALIFLLASKLALPLKATPQIANYLNEKSYSYLQQAICADNNKFDETRALTNSGTVPRYYEGLYVGRDKTTRRENVGE